MALGRYRETEARAREELVLRILANAGQPLRTCEVQARTWGWFAHNTLNRLLHRLAGRGQVRRRKVYIGQDWVASAFEVTR